MNNINKLKNIKINKEKTIIKQHLKTFQKLLLQRLKLKKGKFKKIINKVELNLINPSLLFYSNFANMDCLKMMNIKILH